uniref:MTH538 TIR-like domain (DUF1863) n=1 Tax=Candidatus Kentrum sp. SD TaxID=2126332 RepID=A0A450Y972_9GAMM|nr:MAG: MTH538 TIR-like domain (DUF1863) [Candidatus Kentron sp. SD]VFK42832.1 MAG: MTH538 TIR-like domain (DUF1863) [Candidatus Kentron sp. SD]
MNGYNTTPKHKVFISFHHADQSYKEYLETQWAGQFDGFVSRSVGDGDINPNLSTEYTRQLIRDNFIADATVTIVLVGTGTWRRKHVDWEIGSSIRDTKRNSRTGLLGIFLPTYPLNGNSYNPYTIPPRLYKNVERGYAKIYSWPSSPEDLKTWIHEAFQRREDSIRQRIGAIHPDNTYPGFAHNRSESQPHWSY